MSKLHHTGKDFQYKATYISRKMGQLESRKESDENAAVMATDDGVDIIRNHIKPASWKKSSKLKFEKASNAQQTSLKNKTVKKTKPTSKKGANTVQSKFKR